MFRFFGREYTKAYIGSNGYITFGVADYQFASGIGSPKKPASGVGSKSQFVSFRANPLPASSESLAGQGTPSKGKATETGDTVQLQTLSKEAAHWVVPRISMWFQVMSLWSVSLEAYVGTVICNCIHHFMVIVACSLF